MVRTKLVAVLLGPSGVGLVGLYVSITGLVSTIAQLGIDQSGVREVAEADASGDTERVASVVKTLRRACWFTGILGWILTAVLAWPLSQWTFGSSERMWAVALLGSTVLIGSVTGGQAALLQGVRRIGDLARMQVFSGIITTFIAIGLYAWLRERGIIPVIILTSVIQLGFSWHFSRQVQVSQVPQSWAESARQSQRLIGLGAAFMYGAVLAAIVGLAIRSTIVRSLGLDANGVYQAAWMISGMFAGFILGAMATDFYPRLTAVAHDNEKVNRLVNEQTEIGILLALPGLLGTLAFAPWLMHLLYSAKFLPGAELLPLFVVGVLFQVISWPYGIIQMARGDAKLIVLSRSLGNAIHLALVVLFVRHSGLVGSALAFTGYTLLNGVVAFGIARRLTNFAWTRKVIHLILMTSLLISASLAGQRFSNPTIGSCIGSVLTVFSAIISLRGISLCLGESHKFVQFMVRIPGGRRLVVK